MRNGWWMFGAACLALWVASLIIAIGTGLGLPRFDPKSHQTGCYLRDAMLVYVECAETMRGGSIIEFVAGVAWMLIFYSWTMLPYMFIHSSGGWTSAPMVAFAILWAVSFAGAVIFVIAPIWDWWSWRRV